MYIANARGCGDLPNLQLLSTVKEFSILMHTQRMYELASHFGPFIHVPFLKLVFESKNYNSLGVSLGFKMPQGMLA